MLEQTASPPVLLHFVLAKPVIISILVLSVFRKDKNKLANNASEQSQQHCEHMNNKHIRAIHRERAQPSQFPRPRHSPSRPGEMRRMERRKGNRDNKM